VVSKIAVLMAAYNAEQTIKESIASVMNSTGPCDLVIVDDCSSVPVAALLGPLPERIEVLRLERNSGPALARNHGLEHILTKGEYSYIAIADADDIVYPERLAKQAAFLDANPAVGVVSSWTRFITESGEPFSYRTAPSDPAQLRHCLFFNLTIAHTACMFRASMFEQLGLYSDQYPVAEDYELVRRIARHAQVASLPECLVDYRVWDRNISVRRHRRQVWDRLLVQIKYFEVLEWRAWAGVLRTAGVFLAPVRALNWLKRILYPMIDILPAGEVPPPVYDLGHLRWRVLIGG
jgi:glycosyltransferase involved in cell wall biosynthesis